MIKVATWNVNSLKIRQDQVLDWMDSKQVDILALQETKITDDNFPHEVFSSRHYHIAYTGQKTYNGVALISRFPITNVKINIEGYDDPARRILALTTGGLRVIVLYVPNGAAVDSDKYEYKLTWLAKVQDFIASELAQNPNLVVLGDFNIAPEDCDVHDPAEWEGSVLVSPLEREAFQRLLTLGLKDSVRLLNQQEQVFSWWDYRAAAFRRNRGLRIDHILLSPELFKRAVRAEVDKEPRKAERPSDHAPVWVLLE